jgi:hypothetical protein
VGHESWLHLTAPCLLMKQAQLARADDPSERDLDGDGSAKGPDGHGSVLERRAKGVWVVAVVLELELPIPRQRHRAWRVKNDSLGYDDAGDGRIARTEVGNREAEEDADRSRVVFRFEVLVR